MLVISIFINLLFFWWKSIAFDIKRFNWWNEVSLKSDYILPTWKCVLRQCACCSKCIVSEYESIYITVAPRINFHVYVLFYKYFIHELVCNFCETERTDSKIRSRHMLTVKKLTNGNFMYNSKIAGNNYSEKIFHQKWVIIHIVTCNILYVSSYLNYVNIKIYISVVKFVVFIVIIILMRIKYIIIILRTYYKFDMGNLACYGNLAT